MLEQKDLQMITEAMKEVLEPVHSKLDGLGERMAGLEERIASLEERMSNLETRVDSLEGAVNELKVRVAGLEEGFDELKLRVSHVELLLENETNRNILFIADGHLDLSRKLNEAIKLGQDALAHVERFEIRQVHFDNELSVLKDRVGHLEQERETRYA